jgi:hypothetical protein
MAANNSSAFIVILYAEKLRFKWLNKSIIASITFLVSLWISLLSILSFLTKSFDWDFDLLMFE